MVKKIIFSLIISLIFLFTLESIARVAEYLVDNKSASNAIKMEPKDPEDLRIFFYGGSTVEGEPLPALGFVEQFKFLLKEKYPKLPVTVMNFAVAGEPALFSVRMIEKTLHFNPDVLVVMTAHNEYVRHLTNKEMAMVYNVRDRLYKFALLRMIRRLVNAVIVSQRSEQSLSTVSKGYDRSLPEFAEKKAFFRKNISTIIKLAQDRSTPLILGTMPSNIRDWPPVERQYSSDGQDARYQQMLKEAVVTLSKEGPVSAFQKIKEALNIYPEDATLRYFLAQIALQLEEFERAHTFFTEAKEMDPVPWRAFEEFNAFIRDQDWNQGVYVLDLEKKFEAASEHGLIGFDLIADNVHPTPKGAYLIAVSLLNQLEDMSILNRAEAVQATPSLNDFLQSVGFYDPGDLAVQYLLENARYCMKPFFFNFEASRDYLEQAAQITPTDWVIWANLATVSFLEGETDKGKEELRHAVRFHEGRIDLAQRDKIPYLREALERAQVSLKDFYQTKTPTS